MRGERDLGEQGRANIQERISSTCYLIPELNSDGRLWELFARNLGANLVVALGKRKQPLPFASLLLTVLALLLCTLLKYC